MDSKLEQAREWAERVQYGKALDDVQAAREVIQSLPDQWVDAEKVRELIGDMENFIEGDAPGNPWGEGFDSATWRWAEKLEALLPIPPLPSLADMDENARHALIGKDVKVEGWNNPSMLIAVHKDEGAVLGRNWINPWPFVEVRPLSELTPVDTALECKENA